MISCAAVAMQVMTYSSSATRPNTRHYDETRTNLRRRHSTGWTRHRFFRGGRSTPFGRGDVFFESRRAPTRLRASRLLGCSHFIDDLEEVFLEPSFPPHVQKILFAPTAAVRSGVTRYAICATWQDLCDHVFDRRA